MPIPKIAPSQVELEIEEALYLQKVLQSGVYDQHIAFQIGNIIQKLQVRITVALEGMELVVLNDVIVAPATKNDAVILLAGTQRKVQEQVAKGYQEILASQ